jgi:hypothetical protein
MSKSHKHSTRANKEKATNQARKSGADRAGATKSATPVRPQETAERPFPPDSGTEDTLDPGRAVTGENNGMNRPQQQQKPQPRPHPQQISENGAKITRNKGS